MLSVDFDSVYVIVNFYFSFYFSIVSGYERAQNKDITKEKKVRFT